MKYVLSEKNIYSGGTAVKQILSTKNTDFNKLPRRKQRGIKSQSQQLPSRQAAGNLPAEIK